MSGSECANGSDIPSANGVESAKSPPGRDRRAVPRRRVTKLCGSDAELGNFVLGVERPEGTGDLASRALLGAVEGVTPKRRAATPTWSGHGWTGVATSGEDPQDVGRKYLPDNGACIYVDLDHLELATGEVRSARDHLAVHHAMLRIAATAQRAVNEALPDELSIRVIANNSDGRSHAYGSHTNFLVTRETWDELFDRKLHYMLFLASFQVSGIVFTGQGKVGSENRQPYVPYQLSQRADFFETLSGPQTTWHRPIVNSRDEALSATREGLARLHCIFFDQNLCHVAHYLKVGTMQIVLAMLEAGRVDLDLVLEDPVRAVVDYSHAPDLDGRCALLGGEETTAVDLQRRFHALARVALEAGELDTVAEAEEILRIWGETLDALARGDFDALVGRLDWVLKRRAIEHCLAAQPELGWDSDAARYLDQIYGSLDPDEGLYLAIEKDGGTVQLVDDGTIERFVHEPPGDTRAFTRAHLLRVIHADRIEHIDWHEMIVWCDEGEGRLGRRRIDLGDPLSHGLAEAHAGLIGATDADAIVRAIGEPIVERVHRTEHRGAGPTHGTHGLHASHGPRVSNGSHDERETGYVVRRTPSPAEPHAGGLRGRGPDIGR